MFSFGVKIFNTYNYVVDKFKVFFTKSGKKVFTKSGKLFNLKR